MCSSFNAGRCSELLELIVTATGEEISCSSFVIKKIPLELIYSVRTFVVSNVRLLAEGKRSWKPAVVI